jgi:hypothetical protein
VAHVAHEADDDGEAVVALARLEVALLREGADPLRMEEVERLRLGRLAALHPDDI